MQEEGIAFGQNDFVTHDAFKGGADFIFRPAQIDKGSGMPAECTEFIAQTNVHRRAINALYGRSRLNRQTALIQPGFNIAITKTHGTLSFRALRP